MLAASDRHSDGVSVREDGDGVNDTQDGDGVKVGQDGDGEKVEKEEEQEIRFDPKDVMQKEVRSIVWKMFHFKGTKVKGPNLNLTFCNLCNKKFLYHSATSSMNSHLKAAHIQEYMEAEQETKVKTSKMNLITNYTKTTIKAPKWKTSSVNWKTATSVLAKWLCTNSRPVSIVEDEGFIDFIRCIQPQFEVPSHTTMSNYISDIYEDIKVKTMKDLEKQDYVSVTTDGGSSSNTVSY